MGQARILTLAETNSLLRRPGPRPAVLTPAERSVGELLATGKAFTTAMFVDAVGCHHATAAARLRSLIAKAERAGIAFEDHRKAGKGSGSLRAADPAALRKFLEAAQ